MRKYRVVEAWVYNFPMYRVQVKAWFLWWTLPGWHDHSHCAEVEIRRLNHNEALASKKST